MLRASPRAVILSVRSLLRREGSRADYRYPSVILSEAKNPHVSVAEILRFAQNDNNLTFPRSRRTLPGRNTRFGGEMWYH
ncbi:MAG: hypothetical protein ABFD96_02885 [Armatimonadia bacterium]